ncbi:molecular chaperone DnaJ [Clostridium sp. 'deep sea']|uniref:molecular chaperone DnaJ n=1 Tax=Clostridium sp. 'deep sea' TaxID=2779445 RepID=UPI0018964FD6|nr:molecular chaperone DnaJ [Clostridium sp. 'deep sea']QOR35584.1 molecular chaperone DnaJ [Clostridium sp. 'deep sea']
MADKRDYYDILGVNREASSDELKRAYRKLARSHHPDVSDDPNSEEKFKEINEAYQVLSDPQKRQQYDQFGHAGMGNQGGFEGGFGGFEDIFDMMFNGGFGGRASRTGPQAGADLRYDITLSLEEAVFGVEKEITIRRNEVCDTCNGSGAEPGSKVHTCSQCKGAGKIKRAQQTPFGQFVNVVTCPKCNGKGKTIEKHCETCHGQGKVIKKRRINITIPPGVDNGSRLRVAGKGEAGEHGGPYGDLYVFIRVKTHPHIERRKESLHTKKKISFVQAALGSEISVETLDGKMKLKIPAGTQTGSAFRIENKGVPYNRRGARGNFYVTVQVHVPKKLNNEQIKALSEFAKASGEQVNPPDKTIWDKIKDMF